MAIIGQVDGMEGNYVVGWAAATPNSGNCVIAILNAEGSIIAAGRASRHRPDLASFDLGRTTLAFRIAVPQSPEPRALHVLANGMELPGSPILTGPGQFDGHCVLDGATLTGWTTDRTPDFSPPVITIIDQRGVEVGRGLGKQEPGDTAPLFPKMHFAIELDDQCFGAGEMQLDVLANGIWFSRHICNLKLQGALEAITAQSCAGWLVSPDAPGRAFEIEVYRDGALAGTARCEYGRADVHSNYPDCKTPGFGTTLTQAPHAAMESATISLRFAGSDVELFQGPYVVAERPAAIAAAFRVARLAHLGLPGMGAAERAVLQSALGQFVADARGNEKFIATQQAQTENARRMEPRLVVIIPIYRGIEVTRACIDSVLAHRNMERDHVVLINDASPDPMMAAMLAPYAGQRNVFVLTNASNLGFVQTINRGLSFAAGADVLLLNSDTVVHAGAFDALIRVAYGQSEIGTVTAMSNNATIFSYPNAALRKSALTDITWPELAAAALAENGEMVVDVPTGHGFCLFIKDEVTRRVGSFDEGFGRGYCEENDFCARAAAFGYRHVAAAGVLVEHKESISFTTEKASLIKQNLPRLNALYPEYIPLIMAFERQDGLRAARWGLDRLRLARAVAWGKTFVVVVSNGLDGGTAKAIEDIERRIGYGAASKLSLRCTKDGLLELACEDPLLLASFAPDETAPLFEILSAAAPDRVLVHQLLGFPSQFLVPFTRWVAGRHSVFFAHDFYTFCARVTMIDAIGRFCDVADAETCARCVALGGSHETSRLTDLNAATHRGLFAELLDSFRHVIAPSANAAVYLGRAFPGLEVEVIAHPETQDGMHKPPRAGTDNEIILLGAIGPHKGSDKLLEIAKRARLMHPHLHFRIIGYTNIDKELKAIGNVTITGPFMQEQLETLLSQSRGRLTLFLSSWPETYSYTLSEIVRHGFIPLVPDIGALAERVRAAQFGMVFPFPVDAASVLCLIEDIAAGRVAPYAKRPEPQRFFPPPETLQRLAAVIALPVEPQKPVSRRRMIADDTQSKPRRATLSHGTKHKAPQTEIA